MCCLNKNSGGRYLRLQWNAYFQVPRIARTFCSTCIMSITKHTWQTGTEFEPKIAYCCGRGRGSQSVDWVNDTDLKFHDPHSSVPVPAGQIETDETPYYVTDWVQHSSRYTKPMRTKGVRTCNCQIHYEVLHPWLLATLRCDDRQKDGHVPRHNCHEQNAQEYYLLFLYSQNNKHTIPRLPSPLRTLFSRLGPSAYNTTQQLSCEWIFIIFIQVGLGIGTATSIINGNFWKLLKRAASFFPSPPFPLSYIVPHFFPPFISTLPLPSKARVWRSA